MKKNIIFCTVGLLIGILFGYCFSILISNIKFKEHVKTQTFDECFNYYAKNGGVYESIIKTCETKANNIN